jgi:hypothetical protein
MSVTRTTKRLGVGLALSLVCWLAACGGSDPEAKPLGAGHQELDTGSYILDLVKRDQRGTGPPNLPRIEVTVPGGWFNFDRWGLGKGKALTTSLSFWSVDRVYATPCNWASKPSLDPGRDVSGLAAALASRPLRNATSPKDVELDGLSGKFLQWSVPRNIAFDWSAPADALFTRCDENTFQSWTANGWNSDRFQQAPGQVDRLWILDARGERLVVDAYYLADTTVEDRAELERVVHSIRFLD